MCPKCGEDSDVKDSRETDGGVIRRRRACRECANTWTTYEVEAQSWEALKYLADAKRSAAKMARELQKFEAFLGKRVEA